jgi:hypothetical protein
MFIFRYILDIGPVIMVQKHVEPPKQGLMGGGGGGNRTRAGLALQTPGYHFSPPVKQQCALPGAALRTRLLAFYA